MKQNASEAPPEAAHVFGPRLDLAERYVDHLATTGVEWGLIGPREVPRLWQRHVLNCAVLAPLVPETARVADLGSGAGLPGLVLAICRPDLQVVLVEPLLRRATWLEGVVADLGLPVDVRRARAEQLAGLGVPVVTARAVAPLDRLAGWALPLLGPGGQLLAMKGRSAERELTASRAAVRRAGGITDEIITVGADVLHEAVTVVRITVADMSRREPRSARTPLTRGRPASGGAARRRG